MKKQKPYSIVSNQYRHYWKSVVIWVFGNLFFSSIGAILPLVIMGISIGLEDPENINWFIINFSVGLYSSLILFFWIFGPVLALFGRKVQFKMTKRLRDQLMEKNHLLLMKDTESESAKDNGSKIFTDTQVALNVFWMIPRTVFGSIFPFIVGFYVMFHLDWKIGLFCTSVTLVVIIINIIYQRKAGVKLNLQKNEEVTLLGNTSLDVFKRTEIKTYGSESFELEKFQKQSEMVSKTSYKTTSIFQVALSATRVGKRSLIIFPLLYVLVVFFNNHSLYEREGTIQNEVQNLIVSIGLLVSASGNMSSLLPSFGLIMENWIASRVSTKRVNEYYLQNTESITDGIEIPKISGKIEFKNVSFKYKNKYVFKNFNLTVESGQTIAIIGESGIGKSTLFKLLLRFYEIEKGDILIDGVSIYDYNLHSYRKTFGLLQQKSVSFSGTIKENIIYNSAPGNISSVLKKVGLQNDVEEFELGSDTQVEPNGNPLSGGQQQRLSIARLLFSNPSIVLLDEATSALDSKTEKLIKRSFDSFSKDKTSIIVAHKLSTVKDVDLIVVLGKGGKILQKGTWKQLFSKSEAINELIM